MNYFYRKYKGYKKKKEEKALRKEKARQIYTKDVLRAYEEATIMVK